MESQLKVEMAMNEPVMNLETGGDPIPNNFPNASSPALEGFRLKKALLSHMRDELSTPINAIIGYSEMLLEDMTESGVTDFEADLHKILKEGECLRLVFNKIVNPAQLASTGSDLGLEVFGERIRYEMRTPLNTIIGYCELLLEDAPDVLEGRFVPDLQKMHTAAEQLLALVDELVWFSKLQAGVLNLDLDSLEVSPMIRELITSIQPLHAEQRAQQPVQGHLLVVDDSQVSRELTSQRLIQHGYHVSCASNAVEALDMLAAQSFDLILLDVIMPGMNGYQMLERLKADKTLRHLPVVMLSAVDEIDVVVRCIELGAEDYLPKEVNPVMLKARIHSCLERKRLHEQEVRLLEQEVRLFDELQENYRRLQELESLRDSLTDMIVHDLRTPLTSFLTGLQTVEVLGDLNEDQQEFLGISIDGGQNLLSMINDLLDISKMEGSTMIMERQEVTAADLVQRALQHVSSLTKDKNLTLESIVPVDLPAFLGDKEKLLRTLVNLLGNAIKFTPFEGMVRIEAYINKASSDGAEAKNEICFAITDTGEGIPREAFGRIFEKFGQVESRKAGRKMSTGLGLTFCKMVVEAHGGRIWVESELGQGSTFSFSIPL
ncbi:MAG: response regulator [Abitibacteriaceae bacterium]|nr:response regulator [Abditibacteriaceae bacterium]MBV9865679.1 response regulator [Abditibacteriaceae bacterium]